MEASSDEQSGGLLPKSRTEWQERVQRTISELRRTDLSPCVMECYWRSPAGHLSASIDGVLNEVAIRGGISAQWVEQPHWEPDEDDPDGWQDGTRYRAATGEETSPANSALREALVWHGMRVDENGEHLTDIALLDPLIREPMITHQCESLTRLPIGLVNDLLYETRYHSFGPPINPLTAYANLMENLLEDPENDFWDPRVGELQQ